MRRPKIAIYTMAKNEADHVKRFAETTREADVVVVTDTGSTDGTPDLLRDHNINVHTANIMPWRFDTGTNCALCHVPSDVDICVKLDLDEVIYSVDGLSWRDEIERLWGGGVNQIKYWYTWSWHTPGKIPAVRFRTANVHDRNGFIWRHPGHAGLYGTSGGRTAEAYNFEIHHYMVNKGRPNYMPLLQLAVHENRCPRTLFYLGREYSFRKMHKECISTLTEYLAHNEARWKAERANAMRHIALSFEQLGDKNAAFSWLMRGHGEYPNVRDMWWETLRFFHEQRDFQGGYWAGLKCLAITSRDMQWTAHTAQAWLDEPFILTAKCAREIGRLDEAVRLLKQALELNPDSAVSNEFMNEAGLVIREVTRPTQPLTIL